MQSMSIALPVAVPGKRPSPVLAGSFILACLIEALCVGGGIAWLLASPPPPPPATPAPLTQVMTIEDAPAPPKPVETPPAPITPPVPEKPTPVVKTKPKPAAVAPQPRKAAVQPMSVPSTSAQPAAEAVAPPAEASPPAPAVPAAPAAPPDLAFAAAVRQAVQSAVHYPTVARMRKQTGRAQVAFRYHDGSVADVRIAVSSNVPALDQAALAAVHEATYPPAPKTLAGLTQDYLVWVEFTNAER